MNIKDWTTKHQTIKLLGQRVSFIDTVVGEKIILVIHGYGSCSYDYHKVIDDLKLTYRMVIPDLVGFGASSKPTNYYFSIIEQAEILLNLIQKLKIKELSFIAQGFGASVLCEILSIISSGFSNLKINNIWLLNTSLSVELSPDRQTQDAIVKYINDTFLKISSSFEMFKKYIRKNFNDEKSISDEELSVYWELLNFDDGLKTLNFINYWIVEIQQSSTKWLDSIKKTSADIEIIWGIEKLSADNETPKRINNYLDIKKTHLLENCGKFPMLEKPSIFIDILKGI
ncbi:alpha/beta hydrolase [Polaribacter sp.]|uniref:alpha/beta hydrolase n=1 Tax=Polaribacter sp. TaxID=1920175 RepID=UPI004047AF7B